MTKTAAGTLSTLVCNPKADATLAAFLHSGRFPHAILVEGPPGSGKSVFARRIAQAALCTAESPPCETCGNCVKVKKNIHPDLMVSSGDGTGRSLHVDKIRGLRVQARFTPGEGDRAVLILEDAQTMTIQAQNALLKILEEPPGADIFILTCRNRSELLETILSRVTVVSLEPVGVDECARILAQRLPDTQPELLRQAATEAQGSVGEALRLLNNAEQSPHNHRAAMIFDCLSSGRELEALALLSPYERDRPGLGLLLEGLRARTSALLLSDNPQNAGMRLKLVKTLDIIDRIEHALPQNISGLLAVTSLCAEIASLFEQ